MENPVGDPAVYVWCADMRERRPAAIGRCRSVRMRTLHSLATPARIAERAQVRFVQPNEERASTAPDVMHKRMFCLKPTSDPSRVPYEINLSATERGNKSQK